MGDLTSAVVEAAATRAFKIGAVGEQRAAKRVQDLCGADVLFLLNRRVAIGRRHADVDMVAIGPGGVYVVDIKYYKGKTVEVRRTGGLSSPVKEQLFIGSRDKTSLLDSVANQLEAVRHAMLDLPGSELVSVTSALCFFDAELPQGAQRIGFVPCLAPKSVAQLLSTPGSLDAAARTDLYQHLERKLPPVG